MHHQWNYHRGKTIVEWNVAFIIANTKLTKQYRHSCNDIQIANRRKCNFQVNFKLKSLSAFKHNE